MKPDRVDRRRKPRVPAVTVGSPVAVDSLALVLIRRHLAAKKKRPVLRLVTDEQPRRRVLPE